MKKNFSLFKIEDYLHDEALCKEYLKEVLKEGNESEIKNALFALTKAKLFKFTL